MRNSDLGEIMRAREKEAARVSELTEKIAQALHALSSAVERLNKAVTRLDAKADVLARRVGQVDSMTESQTPSA
jgi:methyl-accepting chemotaxis protein